MDEVNKVFVVTALRRGRRWPWQKWNEYGLSVSMTEEFVAAADVTAVLPHFAYELTLAMYDFEKKNRLRRFDGPIEIRGEWQKYPVAWPLSDQAETKKGGIA